MSHRILIVSAVHGHGGPVQSIRALIDAVDERDFSFSVASQHFAPAQHAFGPRAQISIPIPRPRGIDFAAASLRLASQWKWVKANVDVIHANGLTEAACVLPLARLVKKPVVVWVHNSVMPRPFRALEPLIKRAGFTWLAVSPVAAALVPWGRPAIVPNPVSPSSVGVANRSFGGKLRVVYFGGTDRPLKGFDLIPDVVDASHSDVEFHLYCSPPFSSQDPASTEAWRRLLRLSESGKVKIHGRTQDIGGVLSDAHILFAPSRAESFNRAVAEGLANGLVIVASDIEAHRHLVTSDVGRLFPLSNPAVAGAQIDGIAQDLEALSMMSSAAKVASERFTVGPVARRMADVWEGRPANGG